MVRKVVRILPTGLMIRSGVYYFRIDTRVADGKYKSIRYSLRTKDLEQAIQGVEYMKNFMKTYKDLSPQEQMDFIKWYTHENNGKLTPEEEQELATGDCTSIIKIAYDAWMTQRLDPEELIQTIIENRPKIELSDKGFESSAFERYKESKKACIETIWARYFLSEYAKKHPEILYEFNDVVDLADKSMKHELWEQYKAMREGRPFTVVMSATPEHATTQKIPSHTIQEVFDLMLARQSFARSTIKKRKSDFSIIMEYTGLSMNDDCTKLFDRTVITKIIEGVSRRENTKNDRKNDIFGTMRRFLEHAHKFEKLYDTESLAYLLPVDLKTAKTDKQPKLPFKEEHLAKIFDPQQKYFTKYPERFLACIIALFTGGRINSIATLKYQNIDKDKETGIHYIEFVNDDGKDGKKQLKNDASVRKVPIAKQLLDWGFIDMVQTRKQKVKASSEDFIFSQTNKYTSPSANFMKGFSEYVCEIANIDKKLIKSYSFHSFRKMVSNKLKVLGIEKTIINAICGWDGEGTMEQDYSIHYLEELKPEVDKIKYPEEILHLEVWKKVIPDLYINPEKITKKRKPYKKHINID